MWTVRTGGIGMKLYMAVTPDRYELPLAPPDTAKNLAELFGTTPNNIWAQVSHQKSRGERKRANYHNDIGVRFVLVGKI